MTNIRLFDKTATAWTTQGIGALNPTACTVAEELNGLYELELELPITDRRYADLDLQKIIICKPNPYEAAEPFRIYQISKPIGGIVTVNAAHLSYDLSKYADQPFTATTLAQIMTRLKSNSVETCPFTFQTDMTATGLSYAVKTPRSIRSLLAGAEDGIVEQFGGEWKFTGLTCYLYSQRGQSRGVSIRYGKNMLDLRQEENSANVHSKLYPYWTDAEGNLVEVSGKTITINQNGNGTLVYDMSDAFDTAPTPAELEAAAREYIVTANLAVPAVSLSVKFTQTDLSRDIIYLGDTLAVQFPKLGVSTTARVVKTVYNAILDRYDEIEVGEAQQTFAQTIAGLSSASTTGILGRSVIQAAVDKIAAIITGQVGGYIQLRDNNTDGKIDDFLVKDNEALGSAAKIFKWGINNGYFGLSYTTEGSGGTFNQVITGTSTGAHARFANLYANGNTATKISAVVTGTNTVTSIAASTFTDIVQITLTRGVWVVLGQFRMYAGAAGMAMAGISTTSGAVQTTEGGFAQIATTTNTAQVGISVSRIINVTASSQTVYLVGYQNTGSGIARNITAGQSHLQAVCIG